MNRISAIIFFWGITLVSNNIQAQYISESEGTPENKFNTIKLSPTSFFAHTFMLGYERGISGNKSIQLFGAVTAADQSNSYDNIKSNVLGGSGEVQFRIYVIPNKYKNTLSGLYAAPFGKFQYLKFHIEKNYNNFITLEPDFYLKSWNAGVILGYQFVIKDVFIMDFFAGGGIKLSETDHSNLRMVNDFPMLISQSYTGVAPKAGFRIGIAF
jgi:hypothetical protein